MVAWWQQPQPVYDINVQDYGAVGDGTTNDASAIQGALDAAQGLPFLGAGGDTVLFPPGDYFIGTTGLVAQSSIEMMPGARLIYTGTGTALLVNDVYRGTFDVDIRKPAAQWHDNTERTSIGIRLLNSDYPRLRATVWNFWVGVDLHGDDDGCSYGVIDCVNVVDNMIGFRCSQSGTGWANNHEVRGQIRINSSYPDVVGSRYIDLTGAGNNVTFVNMALEADTPEFTADIAEPYVMFLNCRFEEAPGIRIGTNSYGCLIIGGYGNFGPDPTDVSAVPITLLAGATPPTIISPFGSQLTSTGSGSREGLVLREQTSQAYGVLTARTPYSTFDALRAQITGGGRFHVYREAGQGQGTYPEPVFDLEPNTARLYIGDGTIVPPNYIAPVSATINQFVGSWRYPSTVQLTAASPTAAITYGPNAGDPKVFRGTGTPEGVVTAPVGSQFIRSDGTPSATLYVKETGAAATGWRAL